MTKYLIDTNVISELIKPKPNVSVVKWLSGLSEDDLYLSVIAIGEIRKGIDSLTNSNKKFMLARWVDELVKKYGGKILSIDLSVADKWGYISATSNIKAVDGFIAATALVNNLTLITRNIKDFKGIGLEVIDPFNFG